MNTAPTITAEAWVNAVLKGETQLGYGEWKQEQLQAGPTEEDEGPVLRTYGVRLWATFRAIAETEVEAFSFESAVEKAKGIKHTDFRFEIEDGPEGDETSHVFGPAEDDPNDDDQWGGDGVEIDKRAAGEPFSWVACDLVKELAKFHDFSNPSFAAEKLKDLVKRAHEACQKEE